MFLLCRDNIIFFLKTKELIQKGDELIYYKEKISKTLNIKVKTSNNSFFIKQILSNSLSDINLARNESFVYDMLTKIENYDKNYLKFYFFCDVTKVFAFELIKSRKQELSISISNFKKYCSAIIFFHGHNKELELAQNLPWIFSFFQSNLPQIGQNVVDSETITILANLTQQWNFESIVHNDIKIENFLIKENKLILIDFETTILGDKTWDFASFLQVVLLQLIKKDDGLIVNSNLYYFEKNKLLLRKVVFGFKRNWELKSIEKLLRFCGASILKRLIEMDKSSQNSQKGIYLFGLGMELINKPMNFLKVFIDE